MAAATVCRPVQSVVYAPFWRRGCPGSDGEFLRTVPWHGPYWSGVIRTGPSQAAAQPGRDHRRSGPGGDSGSSRQRLSSCGGPFGRRVAQCRDGLRHLRSLAQDISGYKKAVLFRHVILRAVFLADAVSRRGDGFTTATRATAGTGQSGPFAEGVRAILAFRRFEQECPRGVVRQGFHDMRQMVFHLPFRHAEPLRQLVRRQQGTGQQLDDPPSWCQSR